jgi:hypothetical protein
MISNCPNAFRTKRWITNVLPVSISGLDGVRVVRPAGRARFLIIQDIVDAGIKL